MRGLNIRLKWAVGMVVASVLGKDEAEELWVSYEDALALGHYDFQKGFSSEEPPGIFKDVPDLLDAWSTGWGDAETSEEIRNCPTCQNTESVFCPVHG